ncbi:MAG: immunogenic protein [Clostridia bacterium]|nr:immunogenic protein [Clostridia bacterium]
MKKIVLVLLCVLLAVTVSGCAKTAAVKNTVEGNLKTYYEMTDGTWMCDGRSYQYRLEINGRMPNAAVDSSFVYLSNIREITFDQAYKAAGISSNSEDYFPPEKAVLTEMN